MDASTVDAPMPTPKKKKMSYRDECAWRRMAIARKRIAANNLDIKAQAMRDDADALAEELENLIAANASAA